MTDNANDVVAYQVILFGEHAVVFGKRALAASLSHLRTFALLTTHTEPSIILELPDLPGIKPITWQLHELEPLRSQFVHQRHFIVGSEGWDGTDISADALKQLKAFCADTIPECNRYIEAFIVFLYLYLSISSAAELEESQPKGLKLRIRYFTL